MPDIGDSKAPKNGKVLQSAGSIVYDGPLKLKQAGLAGLVFFCKLDEVP
jgi:hypothetical protein